MRPHKLRPQSRNHNTNINRNRMVYSWLKTWDNEMKINKYCIRFLCVFFFFLYIKSKFMRGKKIREIQCKYELSAAWNSIQTNKQTNSVSIMNVYLLIIRKCYELQSQKCWESNFLNVSKHLTIVVWTECMSPFIQNGSCIFA